MRRIRIFVLTALIAALVVAAAGAADKTDKRKPTKSYRYIANFGVSWGGESASKIEAMYQRLSELILEKTGIKIELIAAKNSEDMFKKVQKGEVQIASMSALEYITAVERKLPIKPVINFTINKKQNTRVCIYARKDSPESQGLAKLRDKRAVLMGVWDWFYFQKHLIDNGVNEKVRDFFSSIKYVEDGQSELYSLVFNKTDVIILTEASYIMERNKDKRFKKIVMLECTGDYPNGPVTAHNSVPREDIDTTMKVFLNMHKDPAFKEFHMYFIAANSTFKPVTADFYKPFHDRVIEARKKGWIKDFDKWMSEQRSEQGK